ncbi:alpha-amylase family glycosyl hydrolase [Bacillaceae bacterium W0354]
MKKVTGLLTAFVLIMSIFNPAPLLAQQDSKDIYYYIMVDRFQNDMENTADVNIEDPNAHHGGDFAGILKRMDHFKQIGVTHVILSPIFESETFSGFDQVNYERIQPTFGDEEALKKLVDAFNKEDIEVVLHFPIDEDYILNNGDEEATSNLVNIAKSLVNDVPIAGLYLSIVDGLPNSLYESFGQAFDDQLLIGEVSRSDVQVNDYLEEGFDKIVSPAFRDKAVDIFSQTNKSLEPLLQSEETFNEDIIHYLDLYHTDRFANSVDLNDYHPVTHWKLALTYLLTMPNDVLIFQGSEVALGGFAEDLSNNKMMTFLTGDDQIIKHMEKITGTMKKRPSLAKGDLNILYAEDSFLVYERSFEKETTVVAINLSDTIKHVDIDLGPGLELRGLIINDLVRENDDGTYTVAVEREASNVFNVQPDSGIYWPMVLVFGGVMSIFIIFSIVMYRKKRHQ